MNKLAVILLGVGLAAAGLWWWSRQAPSPETAWPQKPVRVIVPSGSGGGIDLTARLLGEELGRLWGQSVVVDNRPGSEGLIATTAFVKAHDDHTLLFSPTLAVTLLPLLHGSMPYDTERDLVPISTASAPSIAIAATASFPATSLAELVQQVRAKPGEFVWTAVPGVPDMIFAAIVKLEKLEMRRVAYTQIAAGLQDFTQGRVHIMIGAMPTVEAQVRAGRARLLAVATTARAEAAPEIPTLAEAGYPALTIDGSFGFYGGRGMSSELRDRIAGDVRTVLAEPQLAARLLSMGQTPRASTPEEFSTLNDRQREQLSSLVRLLELGPK